MRLLLTAVALWLLTIASAPAQTSSQFGGYTYPLSSGALCSPTCTGASVYVTIPANTGGAYAFWLGVTSTLSVPPLTNGGLLQFGFQFSPLQAWYEFFCSSGTQCGGNTQITGLTVSVGDVLYLSAQCTVACNGSTSEMWQLIIEDTTTGTTCYVDLVAAGHCGTSSSMLNWPVSQQNITQYVTETHTNAFTVTPWTAVAGATYTTGLPGSQVVHNVPLSLAMMTFGAGGGKTSSPSAPSGVLGNDFNICSPVTSAVYNSCPVTPYPGAIAMGF